MEKQICYWREQASCLGPVGRGRRYPREMRAEAVRLCRAFAAGGGTVKQLAKELGVPGSTLQSWLSREAPDRFPHGALVPVAVVAEPAGSLVRVQLGSAHADVNLGQLAELVRRLS